MLGDDYIDAGDIIIQPDGKKPLMVQNKNGRNIRWAKIIQHLSTNDNWSFVMLSDECEFILYTNDGSEGCWRNNR